MSPAFAQDVTAYRNAGHELVIDGFAGAGGASAGLEEAYRAPDVAINHSPTALAVHRANNPTTKHYISDIFEVDPIEATQGRPVGIGWFSPDCKHFSRASGATPRSKRIRGLAWVIVRWAYQTRPRVILMENVTEFRSWTVLGDDNRPIKELKGRTFQAFCAVMSHGLAPDHPDWPEILAAIGEWVPKDALVRGLGYTLDFRELVAANYGAPTIRNRLYGVMRCDGRPIVWPDAQYHRAPTGHQKPWRSAAECIDFTNLGTSIFARKKPLAAGSQRRIARGCWKHVLTSTKRFMAPLQDTAPHLHAVSCFLEQANAGPNNHHKAGRSLHDPMSSVVGSGSQQQLVAVHLVKRHREGATPPASCAEVLQVPTDALPPSQMKRARRCARFLRRWLPEHAPANDQVVVVGDHVVIDISLRMLHPDELKRAQGFRPDYVIDRGVFRNPDTGRDEWRAITKTEQLKLIGNSVARQVAAALVRANATDGATPYQRNAA